MKLRYLAISAAAVLAAIPIGGLARYEAGRGESCGACHEIRCNLDSWHGSSHRGVKCSECHADAFTLDPGFHLGNLRRLVAHVRGKVDDPVRLRNADIPEMMERCRKCHRQEFAQWQSGPHSVTYAAIFLDKKHNTRETPMDDCLRCHGMAFEGGARELMMPLDRTGPWRLKDPSLAGQPAIPCLACHQIHREGKPLGSRQREHPGLSRDQELFRPSLALYDRRERVHFSVALLPVPAMRDGARPVRMSRDPRQSLCYQCHAPDATMQVASGDDRTAVGVHEGLSCFACHQGHGQQTRASCANCHPRLSNCGLDVEKMDTTFASAASRHNVHFVKCVDCHPKGVPQHKRVEPAMMETSGAARPAPQGE